MHKLIAVTVLALLPSLVAGDGQTFGRMRQIAVASAACTAPSATSFTSRWWADNTANQCGTGKTACATGNTSVYQATDGLSTNQMQNGTTADQPIWTPSAVNGHAAFNFNGTTMAFAATGNDGPTYTVAATFEVLAAPSSAYGNVLDISNGYGSPSNVGVLSSSGVLHPVIFAPGLSTILAGSKTLALNTWYTIVYTLNYAAGSPYPIDIYECSGGSCTLDIASTTTATWASSSEYMGTQGGYALMQENIAEVDILSGSVLTLTQLSSVVGAWSSCQYGV